MMLDDFMDCFYDLLLIYWPNINPVILHDVLFDPMNVIKLDEMLSDAYTITEELDERIN